MNLSNLQAYLQEFCVPVDRVEGRPRLRSTPTGCIQLPRIQTSIGQRGFALSGPAAWNSLLPTSPARLQSVTEHFQAETENSSVRVMTNITRHRCDVFF